MEDLEEMLLEAGEDEEADAAPDEGDAGEEDSKEEGKDDEQSSDDKSKDEDKEAKDAVEQVDQPFSGLDLRAAHCFGYSMPKESNWKSIAEQAEDIGWDNIDKEQLEKSLAKDVEKSYLRLAQFKLVDIDDSMAYSLCFDNNKALWSLEILDSPKAELSIEERADFFKSDIFKKIAKKTYYRLLGAQKVFNEVVKPRCENGELLLVDAVKLDAIMHFLSLDYLMKNLLNGKYLSY